MIVGGGMWHFGGMCIGCMLGISLVLYYLWIWMYPLEAYWCVPRWSRVHIIMLREYWGTRVGEQQHWLVVVHWNSGSRNIVFSFSSRFSLTFIYPSPILNRVAIWTSNSGQSSWSLWHQTHVCYVDSLSRPDQPWTVWKLPWGPLVDDSALYMHPVRKFEWFLEAQETKKTFSDMRRSKIHWQLNFQRM